MVEGGNDDSMSCNVGGSREGNVEDRGEGDVGSTGS